MYVDTRALGSVVTIAASTGSGDHKAFPGVVRAANGNLICVYRQGAAHASAQGDLTKQVSTDGGATWGAPVTIRDTALDLRDCSMVALASGRIGVVFNAAVYNSQTDEHAFVMWSDDYGVTWGTPISIPLGFAALNVVAGSICQCPNGDLLALGYGNEGDRTLGSYPFYIRSCRSTDNGATWSAGVTVVATHATHAWTEPFLCTMDNGEIFCGIRVNEPDDTSNLWGMWSTDNGVTWSAPVMLLPETAAPFCAFQTPEGDLLALVRQWASDPLYRTYTPMFTRSQDRGRTWSSPVTAQLVYAHLYAQFVAISPDGGAGGVGVVWSGGFGTYGAEGEQQASLFFRTFGMTSPYGFTRVPLHHRRGRRRVA